VDAIAGAVKVETLHMAGSEAFGALALSAAAVSASFDDIFQSKYIFTPLVRASVPALGQWLNHSQIA